MSHLYSFRYIFLILFFLFFNVDGQNLDYKRAELFFKKAEYKNALKYYYYAYRSTGDLSILSKIAKCYSNQGDNEKAEECYKKFVQKGL